METSLSWRALMRSALLLVAAASCGATASTTHNDAPSGAGNSGGSGRLAPVAEERALPLVGVRCKQDTCECRELDNFGNPIDTQKETNVPAGKKRFELRFGKTPDDLKLTIAGSGSFSKPSDASPEPACAYVDLPNGRHHVRVRVEALRAENGIAPLVMIKEWGAQAESWYDTLAFRCGTKGPCRDADVADWVKQLRGVERGIHDRCGSVRIQEVRFAGDHAPDHSLTSLDLDFVLHVYDFSPSRPHGADCSKRSPKELDGDPTTTTGAK